MNKYKKILKYVDYISLAISIAVFQFINHHLEDVVMSKLTIVTIALVVITLGNELLPILLTFLIENTPLKRFLLGHQFVDGTWLDIMFEDGRPFAVGISRIKVNKEDINYSGTELSVNLKRTATYRAFMAEFDWPSLKYTYQYRNPEHMAHTLSGYGELDFDARHGSPNLYNGFYIDLSNAKKCYFEGWKVVEKSMLKRIDDPKERELAIKEFFKETKNIQFKDW